MRLSKQATTPVPPKDFWTAVAAAAVLLSGMGFYATQSGHLPRIGPWLWGGALIWAWAVALVHGFRFGRQAFPRLRVVLLLGYTLFAGGQLWAHPPALVSWLSNSGLLMVMAGMLWPCVEFGKRDEEAARKAPASPAAEKET